MMFIFNNTAAEDFEKFSATMFTMCTILMHEKCDSSAGYG